MAAGLYYLGLAFLFTHELDAMTHSEWRLLFVLRGLPDSVASPWFVALHVPLFLAILWLSHSSRDNFRKAVRLAVAGLLVIHAALHFRLSSQEAYEFQGVLSNTLIFGAGACGLAYLAVLWHSSRFSGEHVA